MIELRYLVTYENGTEVAPQCFIVNTVKTLQMRQQRILDGKVLREWSEWEDVKEVEE